VTPANGQPPRSGKGPNNSSPNVSRPEGLFAEIASMDFDPTIMRDGVQLNPKTPDPAEAKDMELLGFQRVKTRMVPGED
jgi:hypothetical protein